MARNVRSAPCAAWSGAVKDFLGWGDIVAKEKDIYEVIEAFSYNMSPKDKKEVRKIIFNHFDYLIEEWNEFQQLKK